jgi:5-methylcytosine-specific restriction endonuclease McrA
VLKSCKYCGKVHESKFNCGKKPIRKRIRYTNADYFRRSQAWTDKAIEIKRRDNYLCQICIRKQYNTLQQYNYDRLSVHHAIPINTDWEKRLDDDNLLTVCSMHHELCESGEIPYEVVKRIIDEQEVKRGE